MYTVSPATIALVEYARGGVTMRPAKDLKELVADLVLNSGSEFAFWAEIEAKKAADIWRHSIEQDLAIEADRREHPENYVDDDE